MDFIVEFLNAASIDMRSSKVIILDFDGVIVESVGIKDQAFNELYQGHPEHIDEIMSYHLAHNATIRFKKFKYISENILKCPYTSGDENRLSSKFADLVFNKIVTCPYVPGALRFLEDFYGRLPMYLVSMSPEEELMRILEQRNLTRYFVKVFSANWQKKDAIGDILQRESIDNTQAVFVGDSYEDYQAALATGVNFVGRNSGKSFKETDFPVRNDLFEIGKLISIAIDKQKGSKM
jgi:phosphoglycolate phosphatase-like HAD superfamily hydrolase